MLLSVGMKICAAPMEIDHRLIHIMCWHASAYLFQLSEAFLAYR